MTDQGRAVGPTDAPGDGSSDGPVTPGRVVAGVRLRGLVGRGATGQVWAGTDLGDGSRVAVKLLDGPLAPADAALAQGPRHPHVLAVHRVQHDPPAVVMPLAGGGSLAAQVGARGGLRPGEVVTVLAPLADALAWLHSHGVVHGDVSATNVLFVERGRPVLADLGSARLAGAGRPVATPGFAAPEVVAGAAATPASDVHGLAAVGWLALTGSLPVDADDRLPLRLLVPECPDELVEAVLRGLDPDPARRPSPSELAALVRESAEPEPVALVPSAALGVRPEEAVTHRVREAARRDRIAARRPGRRARLARRAAALRRWPARLGDRVHGRARPILLGATAAVLAGGLAALLLTTGPPGRTSPAGASSVGAGPVEVVEGLVRARQAALRSGDVGRLGEVHHPEGSTLAADRALLAGGPVEVTYRVLDVDPLTTGGTTQLAAVRLRTGWGTSASVEEDVVVELDRHDGRWLVLHVRR